MSDRAYRHKWWGWGSDSASFDMDGRPELWKWIEDVVGFPLSRPTFEPLDRDTVVLPPRQIDAALERTLREVLRPEQVRTDDDDRLEHTFGRSYRDLVRLRAGSVGAAPDLVVYPESRADVESVVIACREHDAALIPFGGGTNVVGAVEHRDARGRPRVTLDMRRMARLISVDAGSMTAELEAGMFGPQVEEALAEHGLALGHHPDSFVYSTLGGWVATRSAGSHSNAYGKIEDMVVALKMVTPTGLLETRAFPATSHGPDWNRLVLGSEGALGVITSVTVRVHPIPEFEEYRMVLFHSFEDGVAALKECVDRGLTPSVARLSDEQETELMFVAKPPRSGWKALVERVGRRFLEWRGYDRPAAAILAFEGPEETARHRRRGALRICRRHGGMDVGTGPGEAWKKSRYDVPYLRDFLMDYGAVADSLETATLWSQVMPLYREARTAIEACVGQTAGGKGYVGCHLSHLYETGACIYFTVAFQAAAGSSPEDMSRQYSDLKAATTEAFLKNGGTLSHHHAVGYEHYRWMEREHTEVARRAFRSMKETLDPMGIMSPGNLGPQSPD